MALQKKEGGGGSGRGRAGGGVEAAPVGFGPLRLLLNKSFDLEVHVAAMRREGGREGSDVSERRSTGWV